MTAAEYKTQREARKRASQHAITFNPEFELGREKLRWVEATADGLRVLGPVHKIAKREGWSSRDWDITGYYTNAFQDETVAGVVLQLPARDGKELYVPAVEDPNNPDAYAVNFHDATDELRDAASWANSLAEKWAEDEREYDIKSRAEQRIEDAGEEIKALIAEAKGIIAELKGNCDKLTGLTATKRIIREKVKATRAAVRRLRREIARLTDEPWTIDAQRRNCW